MGKIHRNQVCINRSGQAVTIYRTYQPAPDFVVPKFDGEWDEQKIDWYWKQLRKPNAMGSSDAIGTLFPNDVFAVEDDMDQSGPERITVNMGFITSGGPMEMTWPTPAPGGGFYDDSYQTNATWNIFQLPPNVRVRQIKQVVGATTVTHDYYPPNQDGEPMGDFEFSESEGWVKRVERVRLDDHFRRTGTGTYPLNATQAGEWTYQNFGNDSWHCSTTADAAWVEQMDTTEQWAQILYVPFDKTLEGTPPEDVVVGFWDGVLSATINRLPARPFLPRETRCGLVFRAQNADNLWYFAADVGDGTYCIGQRKNGVNTDSFSVVGVKPENGDTMVVNFQGNAIVYTVLDATGEVKGANYLTNNLADYNHVHHKEPGTEDPTFVDFLKDETWHGIFTTAAAHDQTPFPNLVGLQPEDTIFSRLRFRACTIPYDVPLVIEYDQYTYTPLRSEGSSKKVHFHKDGKVQVGYIRSDVDPDVFKPIQQQSKAIATAYPGGEQFYTFQLRRSVPLYAPNGKNVYGSGNQVDVLGEPRPPLLGAGTQVGIVVNNLHSGDTHPDWVRIDYVLNNNPASPHYATWVVVGGHYSTGELNETGLTYFVGGLIPIGLEHGSLPTQINLILNQDKVFRNYGE